MASSIHSSDPFHPHPEEAVTHLKNGPPPRRNSGSECLAPDRRYPSNRQGTLPILVRIVIRTIRLSFEEIRRVMFNRARELTAHSRGMQSSVPQ